DVQTAINNAGWFVNSGAVAGRGTNSGAAKTLVKAGEEVKFIAGDGMNIVQNGKEFTFNAKIVDTYGKQLPVDDNGNYVVRIVNNGNPVGIDDEGKFNTGGGGSGSGKPFTITGNDADGNTSTTTIDGVDNTPGSGVTFVGDENVKVIKQPTQGGDGTDVAVGLQNKVNVGGTSDGTANGTPNAGSVTIDGSNQNGGSITFNNTTPDNSVKVNGDSGSLNLGQGANNNPVHITNVAAGKNGTQDAVNVAQVEDVVGAANKDANGVVKTTGSKGEEYTLKTYNVHGQSEYLTNNVVEAVSKMNEQGIKFFHVNDGTQTPVAQAQNKVDSQAFGKNAVAIGVGSIAEGEDSIAIGTLNNVSGKGSGAIGDPNEVSGSGSYVLGNNNKVATNNTFVLGNEVTNTAANSVFLGDKSAANAKGAGADGKVSSATVGDITYSGFAGEKSVGMVSVGNASEVRRVSGVAAGEISATSTDAINGSQLHSALSNSGVYVTGNGAAPTDANLVKLGNKAGALNFVDGNGTTAVVKGNTVTFDTVPGYADGIKAGDNVVFNYEDNTDAAGNPLYVTTTGGTTTDATDPNVKVDANGNPVKQQTTVINAKQPDLRPLQHQVEQVENNAYAGVAQAMATAGLPQAYLPGKSMVAVAGGYYKGEQGYALGVSSISDSGNWVFKATASGNSRNNFGGTVGAGYQW
ncbi:MAG: YadA-like family protein, partial [Neisseriaceae bacterium]|nr:YadA-like family protein [Neisseriaceae bacterium]